MGSSLEEVNKSFKKRYLNFEISLWPTRPEEFKVNLWDGQSHAPIRQNDYAGTSEEFIKWVTRRKILFQKFDKIKNHLAKD